MKSRKYHVALIINGERKHMTIHAVYQEYGVSEQDFFDVTVHLDDRQMTARGDTLDIALNNLKDAVEYQAEMALMAVEMRKAFNDCMEKCKNQFRTPVID